VIIIDGTLVPTCDHTVAEQSKYYRYSTNHQIVIDADTQLIVAVGQPLPGNRNDCKTWKLSGAKAAVGNTTVIAESSRPGPQGQLRATPASAGTTRRACRHAHGAWSDHRRHGDDSRKLVPSTPTGELPPASAVQGRATPADVQTTLVRRRADAPSVSNSRGRWDDVSACAVTSVSTEQPPRTRGRLFVELEHHCLCRATPADPGTTDACRMRSRWPREQSPEARGRPATAPGHGAGTPGYSRRRGEDQPRCRSTAADPELPRRRGDDSNPGLRSRKTLVKCTLEARLPRSSPAGSRADTARAPACGGPSALSRRNPDGRLRD
jgi:hypothetical protein